MSVSVYKSCLGVSESLRVLVMCECVSVSVRCLRVVSESISECGRGVSESASSGELSV